jgi:hypothetical protein
MESTRSRKAPQTENGLDKARLTEIANLLEYTAFCQQKQYSYVPEFAFDFER